MAKSKDTLAARLATALQSTSDRYLRGFMSRGTWTDHMTALWRQVEAAGLRAQVMKLVDPLSHKGASR